MLGGMGKVSEKDFDFSPMEERIGAIENQQKYIMIGLAILILLILMKK
jgi:hypothetical protein